MKKVQEETNISRYVDMNNCWILFVSQTPQEVHAPCKIYTSLKESQSKAIAGLHFLFQSVYTQRFSWRNKDFSPLTQAKKPCADYQISTMS